MKPLVTVAIPTLNRASYLRETVESVLAQDYENLEIIVSDNGSTDETPAVLAELCRLYPRLRPRRNETPAPLVEHFNQCVEEAQGKFFVLLSDDDRINASFIRNLAETLVANRRVSVAVPANVIIDDRGEITRTLPVPEETFYEGIDFVIDWLWKRRDLPVANLVTVMGRTELMRTFRYQPFPHGLNSDNLLFLQLALSGHVAFCREAIFFWRLHPSQQARQCPPELVSQAGREFQGFIRRDRNLQRLILSHHPQQQKLVRRGVRQMTAEAYLYNIGFFGRPLAWQTIKHLLAYDADSAFLRLVLRHYYRMLRKGVGGRPMSAVGV